MKAQLVRIAVTDVVVALLAAVAGYGLGADSSPLRSPAHSRDVVGLVMQVGGGVAALVLAPMAVTVALRPGLRTDAVLKLDGDRFAAASVWAVLASVGAAALAFAALLLGGSNPSRWLARASYVALAASFLAVVRVSRRFVVILKARNNDTNNPMDRPYLRAERATTNAPH